MHRHPKSTLARAQRVLAAAPGAPRHGALGAALLCLVLAGCADDLQLDTGTTPTDAKVVTDSDGSDSFTTRVDASSRDSWIYFSFATQAEVFPADPALSSDWDLGFQRFNIISNGGASGPAGVAVAILDGQSFEAVAAAPAGGYLEDQPDSDDDDELVDSAFSEGDGWYDYDQTDNTLSPKAIVYVVRTASGTYKLHMLDYYDEAGTSANPSFTWASLPSP